MSTVRFIADLHFGHKFCSEKRGFNSTEEHDDFIVQKWNSRVHKRDVTYVLGDITMESSKEYHRLDQLNGRKIVVLGNHDMPKDIPLLMQHVDKIAGMIKYKGVFLSHAPIHPMELDYRVSHNIHGHIHDKVVYNNGCPDPRYHCVSCEQVDFIPRTLHELGIER